MTFLLHLDRPLPEGAQQDIETVVSHVEQLIGVLTSARSSGLDVGKTFAIREIANGLGVDFPVASRVLNTLDNLHEFRQQSKSTPEVVGAISKRLNASRAETLISKADKIIHLIDIYNHDHPFMIISKSERLSYLHENLYQDAEIITNITPIFSEEAQKLIRLVVTHSLVVSIYRRGSRAERLHLAMDAADVIRLRDLCDRAITKANTLKESLVGETWEVQVLNETRSGE